MSFNMREFVTQLLKQTSQIWLPNLQSFFLNRNWRFRFLFHSMFLWYDQLEIVLRCDKYTHLYEQLPSKTGLQVDTTVKQLQMVYKSVCGCVRMSVSVWCLNTEYMGGFIVPHVNKVLCPSIHPKSLSDTYSLIPLAALPAVCLT